MNLSPGQEWTPDTLQSALRERGLDLAPRCDEDLAQAANRLLALQHLLATSLPSTHLPSGDILMLAPIAEWLA